MSLFNELGRKVEELKQEVGNGDDETYQCQACEELFRGDRDTCPECGSSDRSQIAAE